MKPDFRVVAQTSIYGNIGKHVYPKTNLVLKPQNLLKSYTMLSGESQTCRLCQVVKLHWGGSATNEATSSSFTGASLYTAGTKLDLCLKKQLFIYKMR